MITIDFYPTDNSVAIVLDEAQHCAQAVLLTTGGEEAEQFPLAAGYNQLQLHHHLPGTYSLRIDCENEVVVRQVVLA